MKLCLGPGYVSGSQRVRIAYCQQALVPAVCDPVAMLPDYGETLRADATTARAYAQRYRDAGVELLGFAMEPLFPATIAGGEIMEAAVGARRRLFEAMQAADLQLFTQTLRLPKHPTDAENEAQLERLFAFYRRLLPTAEQAGIRIATHSTWAPDTNGWMWGVAAFTRFLDALPSPANGYLFDNAIVYMLGDDPAEAVRTFAGKIPFCHLRDVRRAADGPGVDGTGYDETWPGAGELDQLATLRALKETDFAGGLMPEHQPPLDVDHSGAASHAWTVGYYRALLAQL
jgi:sugar phosphate isomerase/epimerase